MWYILNINLNQNDGNKQLNFEKVWHLNQIFASNKGNKYIAGLNDASQMTRELAVNFMYHWQWFLQHLNYLFKMTNILYQKAQKNREDTKRPEKKYST